MAILVVGGKGFIGSQVTRRLLARGETVVCFEPRATPGRLGHLADKVTMEVGSIADFDDVLRVFTTHHITHVAGLVFFAFSRLVRRTAHSYAVMCLGILSVSRLGAGTFGQDLLDRHREFLGDARLHHERVDS